MRAKKHLDIGCIILLLIFAACTSSDVLFTKGIPSGPTRLVFTHDPAWYTASAMVACHQGFKDADPSKFPGFPEFLRQERQDARIEARGDAPLSEPGFDVLRHRYWLTLVGWLWGVFGISWNVVRYLMVALFCVTAIFIYGIFRLGMGRLVSLAGTALSLTTPLVLDTLQNPRDFCKAPFIIAAILVMGYLIRYAVSPRKLLGAAAGLGLISGIGFGFRTDAAMALLPGAVVLVLFASIKATPPSSLFSSFPNFHSCLSSSLMRGLTVRVTAVLLQVAVFAIAAWPVLKSEYECGSLFYHYFLIGLHTHTDDDIGMERASYERMYKESDLFVFDTRETFVNRMKLEGLPGAKNVINWQNRHVAFEFIKTFPGDMVARAYSAMLAIAGGNERLPAAQKYRIYIIAATLFLIACCRLSWAWGALALGAYFCGIMSYQFQLRHTFHLAFLNWWMLGFLLDRLLRGIRGQDLRLGVIKASLLRGFLFAACAATVFAGPLYLSRLCQDHAFQHILSKYEHAQLEEVETQSFPSGDWVLFSPKDKLKSEAYQAQQVTKPVMGQYWVLEVAEPPKEFCVFVQYDVDSHSDYTKLLRAGSFTPGTGHAARFFFPVYEQDQREDGFLCRFAGIALPKELAPRFKRLSIVRNIQDFPLLYTLSLPDNPPDFVSHQAFPYNWKEAEILCDSAAFDATRQDSIRRTARVMACKTSEPAQAVEAAQAALLLYPRDIVLYLLLSQSLDAQGAWENAVGACLAALNVCADYHPVYLEVDRLLRERKDPAARIKLWRQIAGQYPAGLYPALFLGRALEDAGMKDEARAAYNQAAQLSPSNEQAAAAVRRLSTR